MSEAAPEATGFEAKLEALAAEGFHLVVKQAEKFVIEKTHLDGTLRFHGSSLEEVISLVESALEKFPGRFGHSVSRTDGIHESLDGLQAQAGKPEPGEGQSGTSPSAPIEKVDVAPAENAGAGANAVSPEPEVEGTPESAAVIDTSGVVAEEPGETATGRVGTEEDAPAPEATPAPEGSVES